MADTAPTVTVEEKSAWLSKVNWTQVLTVIFTMLAAFGFNVPEDMRVNIMAAVAALGGLVTVVMRTYFTTTVTPSSASKL